jgi:hypothetical protein
MTIAKTGFAKLYLSLTTSMTPELNFKTHLNMSLWMKLLCSSKEELFSNNISGIYKWKR